ncbi:MAG TPA: retroviral-like aspartic protease family protein [Thermoanaerobaculia bacterium]|nr:retroviral-like aspartic protease family protein [Thermoanaerobaculia bacterium]
MRVRRAAALSLLLIGGCALHSQVSVTPAFLLPSDIRMWGSGVVDLAAAGDYPRAISYAAALEAKERPSAKEFLALGRAELAGGRLDDARRHLRRSLDLRGTRDDVGAAGWALSETEYLANNFEAAYDWAEFAVDNGMVIRRWHLDFLSSLRGVRAFEMPAARSTVLEMKIGNPEIPRIRARVNAAHAIDAVIDTGAVMSIVSRTYATVAGIRSAGDYTGTFVGLLGEPIEVRFGIVDSLRLGDLEVRNVPVAIMADDQLRFLVFNNDEFRMDFLIGTNLLKEFRVELDFRHETVTLQPLPPGSRAPVAEQNLFFVGFRPMVQAAINRKGWYLFIIDTGSEVTFLNEELISGTPVRRSMRFHGATLQGLGGAQKRGEKVEDVEIAVDAWGGKFRNIPLYASEQENAFGIIGQNFLRNFRVVIDFASMRVDLFRDRGPFRKSAIETGE